MIILVAVTLNIALGENGLIAKAKETRTKQEEQTIYEDIQGMMELNNNGEIEVDKTVDNVKVKYPGTELSGTTLTVPGQYGRYKYTIIPEIIKIGEEDLIIEKGYYSATYYNVVKYGIQVLSNDNIIMFSNIANGAFCEGLQITNTCHIEETATRTKSDGTTEIYSNAIISENNGANGNILGYITEDKELVIIIDENTLVLAKTSEEFENSSNIKTLYCSEDPTDENEKVYEIVGFDEEKSKFYLGNMTGKYFTYSWELDCVADESFIATMEDDTENTKYEGKKVIFAQNIVDTKKQPYKIIYGYVDEDLNEFIKLNCEYKSGTVGYDNELLTGKFTKITEGKKYKMVKQ